MEAVRGMVRLFSGITHLVQLKLIVKILDMWFVSKIA